MVSIKIEFELTERIIRTTKDQRTVVRNMALAASGKATMAICSVVAFLLSSRAFFHLSAATKMSSAPNANTTYTPIKFRKGL